MNSVLNAILAVFLAVAQWIGSAVTAITPMFWAVDTGLTFLGTLAVSGLAFAVAFLIIGLIQSFLKFRG